MLNPPPHELFAERPVRSEFARSGVPYAVRRLMTLVVIAAVVGGLGAWIFSRFEPSNIPEIIPTIKSDGAYKQRPAQPGGIDIPHQDVELYKGLENRGTASAEVEHLLPPPETPQPVESAPPSAAASPSISAVENLISADQKIKVETTVTPTAPPTTGMTAPVAPAPMAAPQTAVTAQPAGTASAPRVDASPSTVAAIMSPPAEAVAPIASPPLHLHEAIEQPKPQAIKPVVASAPPAKIAAGKAVAQLASVQNETAAEALAKQLQRKHASALGGATLHVIRANLGAKGIYYRIQSLPVSSAQAEKICAAIKQSNASCILVRN